MIGRRDFITLLGGTAAWPLAARAQQSQRMRRIGVLMSDRPDDTEARQRLAAFLQKMEQLGWTDGQNAQIHTHWGAGDVARIRSSAEQLATLAPAVFLASGSPAVAALRRPCIGRIR
jgi:putative tryptophan/tyrosine transport system substrate-binding protein